MKKYIVKLFTVCLMASGVGFTSCSEDDLNNQSVIVDSQKEENEFDRWIQTNYVTPYNIDFKYRMEDIESDMNYYLVPAEYSKSIQMAKLMKFLCLEAYDEITGSKDFIRSYYPKMIHLVGSAAYRNNGTMVLGTAEGGLKITMYHINDMIIEPEYLNHYYFKTMHHEFGHILNQTKPYSSDFDMISGSKYVTDSWNTTYKDGPDDPDPTACLRDGFISPYAASGAGEDFVELLAIYVTSTTAVWNSKMKAAGESGLPIIQSKFDIVYNYMLNSWNIDLDELRDIIQRRQSELNTLDLDNL